MAFATARRDHAFDETANAPHSDCAYQNPMERSMPKIKVLSSYKKLIGVEKRW